MNINIYTRDSRPKCAMLFGERMSKALTTALYKRRAERHLPQAGQAVEDALRHARQLVLGQRKGPVGMADMS